MNKTPFSAVILDMDGLVLDTEPVYQKAWQYGGKQLGYELTNQLCETFSGNSLQAIQRSLQLEFGTDFDFDRFIQISSQHWYELIADQGVQPMPGALHLLEMLQNRQINYALATNSPAHIAEHCLQHAGIDAHFSVRVTSDEVEQTKPAPDIYQLAMKKLNAPAHQCLCIEDSLPGIQSAHQAGGITVLISEKQIEKNASNHIHYQFSSLTQLANVFQ